MTADAAETIEVGFRPSSDGWHFANAWPQGAPAGLAGITLGRVYGGLCGGMCVLAGQAWRSGARLPQDRTVPADGPITARLWAAQLASMRLPGGPLRYLRLQLPTASAARRRSTLGEAIPSVRAALRAGRPALLGLVRAISWNPAALGSHHVVLVYRLQVRRRPAGLPAERVALDVYDPNHPDDDRVRLEAGPDGAVGHSRSQLPVFAMVRLD